MAAKPGGQFAAAGDQQEFRVHRQALGMDHARDPHAGAPQFFDQLRRDPPLCVVNKELHRHSALDRLFEAAA